MNSTASLIFLTILLMVRSSFGAPSFNLKPNILMKYEFVSKLSNGDKSVNTLTVLSNGKVDLLKELPGQSSSSKVATLSKDSIDRILSKISKVSESAGMVSDGGQLVSDCKSEATSLCSIVKDGKEIAISQYKNCDYQVIDDAHGAQLERIIEGLNKINAP